MEKRSLGVAVRGVICVAVLAAACRGKSGPPLKVTGAPTGAVSAGKVLVRAQFDHPMVGKEAVGKPAKAPPMRISPERPGEFTWIDAKTLAWSPAEPLPRSTGFEVVVPAGTTAADGARLAQPFRFAFETPRIGGRAWLSSALGYEVEKFAPSDQKIRLELTQPAQASEVGRRCRFAASSTATSVRIVDEKSDEADGRTTFRLVPSTALALDTDWTFRCDQEMRGVEGRLSLARPIEAPFHTYGPLRVVNVAPSGGDVDIDDTAIVVTLSTPPADRPPPIKIDPPVEGFPGRASVDGAHVRFHAYSLEPGRDYTITIPAGLRDVFGQTLPAEHKATFRTGNGKPRLDLETGLWMVEAWRAGYPIWQRNLTRLEVEAAVIPESRLTDVLPRLNWWDAESVDFRKLRLPSVKKTIEVKGRLNHWDQFTLDPKEILGAGGPGIYYFAVRAPETIEASTRPGKEPQRAQLHEALVAFTNLGVTSKLAAAAGMVWVTRLDSGAPVAGADVTVRDRDGKVKWKGKTGADGTVTTPGRVALTGASPAARRPLRDPEGGDGEEGDGEEGGDGEEYGGERGSGLLVFARVGGDVAWLDPGRTGGLEAWNFHVASDYAESAVRLRGYLHSDRGLYRPGDTVHLRGLARTMKLGEGLRVPVAKKVDVTVRDPRGNQILTKAVTLSKYGGISFDVALPADARLGDYSVGAQMKEGAFRETFSVEEYRPAAFEVKAKAAAAPPVVAGGRIRIDADARYLYGSPVRGAKIVWRVHSRPRHPSFKEFAGYSFEDTASRDYWWDRSRDSESFVAEEEKTLDKEGHGRYALRIDPKDLAESRDYMVAAEVRDETKQMIAANVAVPVHRSGLYLGVDAGSPVAESGKPRKFKLVAVDPEGKRIAASAEVKLVRVEWKCAWEAWGYHGSYRCEEKTTDAGKQTVAIPADRAAEAAFPLAGSGEYRVVAEGKDPHGHPAVASERFWVWGGDESGWRVDDTPRFEITADKPSYKAGDTAKLLLKTPLKQATGMITIEREGVLERRPFALEGAGGTVDVPIKEGYAPNVYVSVMLVRGRTGKGGRGMPMMRMGLVNLPVEVEGKRLTVTVETDHESYRPGETVTATVEVKDGAGKPVQGEIALAAADEGVLSLIAFKTPDPVPTFFAPWGLGVATATEYDRLARLPEPGEERYATGGDGGGKLGTFRSRFLATAYWNPKLETDGSGKATVTFPAPDNLTAFRLMAVVADAGDRFGSGDRRFTVRKPLQILSALPRFLTVGDEPQAAVVVINETGAAGTATIETTVKGVALAGKSTHKVSVAAGGRVPVVFPLRVAHEGQARLRFAATLGAEKDGLEVTLPVSYPAPMEALLVAEGETRDSRTIDVKLPEGTLTSSGALEISVDPDGLAGLEEGLRSLIEYPYGCLEQTTSRVIPLVMVEELSKALALADLDGPKLQQFIREGVQKIGRFQTDSGGFTLWTGGNQPEPYLTAFALWGLQLARKAGHPVDQKRIDDGVAWLRRSLQSNEAPAHGVHDELGEMGSRAFALHVLAMLGRPEPGFASKLLERKDALPRFGIALLARALGSSLGAKDAAVQGLLDGLVSAVEVKDGRGMVREPGGERLHWYMSDDARTTAMVTDAFLELRPDEPRLPELVRGLLGERRAGRWETTQDNLYALVALTHWAQSRKSERVEAVVKLGSKTLIDETLTGAAPRVRHATLPMSAVASADGPLAVTAKGGPVHFSARLRYRRAVQHQAESASPGLTLRREILDPATDRPVGAIKVGDTVRVRVTLGSERPLEHLAIVDRLPAGLEPVNTKFRTTSSAVRDKQPGDSDYDWRTWLSHKELRDDRVEMFVDEFWTGTTTYEFLARATTAGRFVVPAATAEEMYQPETHARLAIGTLEVKAK